MNHPSDARNDSRSSRLKIITTTVIAVIVLLTLLSPAFAAQSSLTITTPSPLPEGTATLMYAQTLAATGGAAPYTWAIIGGTVPAGLTLGSSGVLSGTIMSSGAFSFIVQITDSNNDTAEKVFTLVINNPLAMIEFIPASPTTADSASIRVFGNWPNGCVPRNPVVSRVGTDIRITTANQSQVCTAAVTPYSVTAAVGQLPVDTYQVIVSHAFPGGLIELLRTSLPVVNPAPTISSLNPMAATAGIAGLTLTVNGTKFINGSQVRWNGADRATTFISSTQLTATISSNDLAFAGTASVTVFNPLPGGGVSNAQSLAINAPLVITTATTLPVGIFGRSYALTLSSTGGTLPHVWSVTGGTLPSGLALNTAGQLSGTPAVFGDFGFTAQVRDSFGTTATRTFTLRIEGGADLTITQNITLNQNQALITKTITVTNNGPAPAQSVIVTDSLPAAVTFVSCASTGGGLCEGSGNNRTVKFTALASGAAAVITLITTPVCATTGNQSFNNTAAISSATPDQNPANNSVTSTVSLNCQAVPVLSLAGGKAAFNFGTVQVNSASASDTFVLENKGNAALTASFNVRRTGAEVASGRITNADDNATFPLRLINDNGTETPVVPGSSSGQVRFLPGQLRSFRLLFTPNIPAPAGKTSGFSASQILPDAITAEMTVSSNSVALPVISLSGNIDGRARLINPLATKLPPLIAIARNGDELTVEASLYDPNNDSYLLTYQFLDSAGRQIGSVLSEDLNLGATPLLRGQSFTTVKKFRLGGLEVNRVRVTVFDRTWDEAALSSTPGTVPGRVINVSAASYRETALASEAIVAAFGNRLATSTQVAEGVPLPLRLGGTQVFIRDSQAVERAAPLFFVSPEQINFLIPEGTAPGLATLLVANGEQVVATETRLIEAISPGLFTANANGSGVAAAVALRLKPDNSLSYEAIAEFDGRQFVPRPIDFGAGDDQLFLALFGTGLRHHGGNVTARIGEIEAEVLYAGAQGGFAGLDQINLRLPRSLAGRGEVEIILSVDGKITNTVRASFR